MKGKRNVMLAVLLILVLVFSLGALVACGDNEPPEGQHGGGGNDNLPGREIGVGDDYSIALYGIGTAPIFVTKGEIKRLYNENADARVEYTADNPCYASDKTDDKGEKIPHTAKGVKFSAIIEEFVPGVSLSDFSQIEVQAADAYGTILVSEDFNGENPMIIAFEYDGKVLNASQSSGELRVVIDGRPAATWAKKAFDFKLSSETLVPPVPAEFTFIEEYDSEEYLSVFDKTVAIGAGNATTTYKGASIQKLIELDALAATETDKMYVTAWDYEYTGSSGIYSDFISFKPYRNFIDAYLVFYQKENGAFVPADAAPELNSPAYQKGMNVKNVLSLSASDKAVVSFKMANSKFNADNANDGISAEALLKHINMWKDGGIYVLTLKDGSAKELANEDIKTAKVIEADGVISLGIGNKNYPFKKLALKG